MVDAILIAMLVAIEPARDPAIPSLTHTRPLSDEARRLVAEARRLSPTIESMLAEIERSDVIAYIDVTAGYDAGVGGTTRLNAAVAEARFLRVTVSLRLDRDRRIEVLGHELRHVLEVSRDAGVRNDDGMQRLFRRIGWRYRPSEYETDAAVDVEAIVRREMWETRRGVSSRPTDARR